MLMSILCVREQNRYTRAGSQCGRQTGGQAMSRFDRPPHRIFMTFFYRAGCQVQFVEADLKTPLCPASSPLPTRRRSRSWLAAGRPGATQKAGSLLEHAIENGRGG